jgi:hypothetical protein
MKNIVTLLLFLFSLSAMAQDTLPRTRGYFGIAAGVGFPLQNFVKKDFDNAKSGFANTGSNLQLNFSRHTIKNISILVRGNINTNPYDVYELSKSYNTKDTFNDINYTVTSSNWYCVGGMVGLSYTFPIQDFAVEIHGLAGYQYAESPRVNTTLSNGNDSTTIQLTKGTSSGLVWTAGTTLSYQISSVFSVAAGVEYYMFKGTFSNSKIVIDGTPLTNRNNFDMDIRVLNCTAAVRYHF